MRTLDEGSDWLSGVPAVHAAGALGSPQRVAQMTEEPKKEGGAYQRETKMPAISLTR